MGINADLVQRAWSSFENGDYSNFAEYLSEDVTFTMPGAELHGLEEMEQMVRGWWTAFPDLRHEITAYVEDGDTFACQLTMRGTHTGPLVSPDGEVPATGRSITFQSCDYIRIRGGKIVEWNAYFDNMAFLGQLGLLPEPAGAGA